MLKIVITEQFAVDYKNQKSLGKDLNALKAVTEDLVHQRELPLYCCDGPVPGGRGRGNCKIGYDWWLVYKLDAEVGTITLERTGSVQF